MSTPTWQPLALPELPHHLLQNMRGAGRIENYSLSIAAAPAAAELSSSSGAGGAARAIVTLGGLVCGHPTIIHGGMLAALL